MSLRDLVEGDCGGTNSLVKLSTHLVQDHAFKDQDLKLSTQNENNDQLFLQTNPGEVNQIQLNNIGRYNLNGFLFSWWMNFLAPWKLKHSKWIAF